MFFHHLLSQRISKVIFMWSGDDKDDPRQHLPIIDDSLMDPYGEGTEFIESIKVSSLICLHSVSQW